ISNLSNPAYASKLNREYWLHNPYVGFGAGAHSFAGSERWPNTADSAAYVQAMAAGYTPVEQLEDISAAQAIEEELFLGLRQLEGIDLARLERAYGTSLEPRFAPLEAAGWIERAGSGARLVPDRLSISNEAFVELMR